MGSNAAENHPISFRWVMEAKARGAKLIHVDPRYTKTSKQADVYAALRSGSDIPFLGGMINYILQKDLIQKDYVRLYTNASFIVNKDFKMPGELDGVFSGYDAKARKYDKAAWAFEVGADGVIKKDPTFQHPMCVYQLLKKHYSRYDLDTVSAITGTPEGGPAQGLRDLRLDAREGQGRHLDVRDGLDAAHGRHAEHHRDVDHPAAAREHGHGRRRHQRAARREQRAGLDRLRPALPHPAELPAGAQRREGHARGLRQAVRPGRDQGAAERLLARRTRTSTSSATSRRSSARTRRRRTSSATSGCRSSTTGRTPPGS